MTEKGITLYHGTNSNIFLSMQKVGPRLLSRNKLRQLGGLPFTGEFLKGRRYEGDIVCFSGIMQTYYAGNRFDPAWVEEIIKDMQGTDQTEQRCFLQETLDAYNSVSSDQKNMIHRSFPLVFRFKVPNLELFGEFHKTYDYPQKEYQFLHEVPLLPFLEAVLVPSRTTGLGKLLHISRLDSINPKVVVSDVLSERFDN